MEGIGVVLVVVVVVDVSVCFDSIGSMGSIRSRLVEVVVRVFLLVVGYYSMNSNRKLFYNAFQRLKWFVLLNMFLVLTDLE